VPLATGWRLAGDGVVPGGALVVGA